MKAQLINTLSKSLPSSAEVESLQCIMRNDPHKGVQCKKLSKDIQGFKLGFTKTHIIHTKLRMKAK